MTSHLFVCGPFHRQFIDTSDMRTSMSGGLDLVADGGVIHHYYAVEVAITNSLRERQSWWAYAHYEIPPIDRLAAVLHAALTIAQAGGQA